jgi:hypothetical protein
MSTPMTEFPMPLPRTTRLLIDGGGGTTAVPEPPRVPFAIPRPVRCSCIGNRGEGGTTTEGPMSMSRLPGTRIEP